MLRRLESVFDVREIGRQLRHVVLSALLIGILTGTGVALFYLLVWGWLLPAVRRLALPLVALAPLVGLGLARLTVTRILPVPDSESTDAYVKAYHRFRGRLPLSDLPAKLLASAATLGLGNAMGFEGPSILIGGTTGSSWAHLARRRKWVPEEASRTLMVAGAAAGVAAVFKAPLTGVVFALEVPFQADLARDALLPSLVSASASYLVFAGLSGTEPILPISPGAPFNLPDLAGAVLVGATCGLLARLGAWAIVRAKHLTLRPSLRILGAGLLMAMLAVASGLFFGDPLATGPGYNAVEWVTSAPRPVSALVLLFTLRAAATWCAVAGGGVGGLFIPLVIQGALTGAIVQAILQVPNETLFPVLGVAAFLGAGYHSPLAGVAFVAEATGQHGFVVPALVATVAAQLLMGSGSFSVYQRRERIEGLAHLLQRPVSSAMISSPSTLSGAASVQDFMREQVRRRHRWFPVVIDDLYAGTISLREAASVPSSAWSSTQVEDVMRHDRPTVAPDAPLHVALRLMRSAHATRIAVVEDERVVGVLTRTDLADLPLD